jgi:hypothetical protein
LISVKQLRLHLYLRSVDRNKIIIYINIFILIYIMLKIIQEIKKNIVNNSFITHIYFVMKIGDG